MSTGRPMFAPVTPDAIPWVDYLDRAYIRQEIMPSLRRLAETIRQEEQYE